MTSSLLLLSLLTAGTCTSSNGRGSSATPGEERERVEPLKTP
uniref:Uncharacterized protein n=1 Tax=Amphimedon queenslandica TaxID=400682 RepID=A0A1X7VAS5_AMPQE